MELYSIEDGCLRLNLHDGQYRAWQSKKRFTFLLAGTQGGKTTFGPWWLYREVELRGAGDYMAVTSSYDLFKLKMLPSIRNVFEDVMAHRQMRGRYWASDRVLELSDPSTGRFWAKSSDDRMWGRIMLRSASSPSGLESATAKGAWLDECGQEEFTLESWQAIRRRLSLAQGRVLGTTTPYNMGWIWKTFFVPWQNAVEEGSVEASNFEIIQFDSIVNPSFPLEEYFEAQASMQPWRFDMFYRGLFTKPAGTIYDCFGRHAVVKPFEIPKNWNRYAGVDFGGANTAVVLLALDPNTKICYAYKCDLQSQQATKDRVLAVKRMDSTSPLKMVWGGSPGEEQFRIDWSEAGLPVNRPPISDVETQIDKTYSLINTGRFKVFSNLTSLIDEFSTYKRKLDPDGVPTNDIQDKKLFHRLDALRSVCTGLSLGPARITRGFYK